MLKRRGVKHNVLNAKFHEREAEIVAQAGRSGAVTIATNMAGRGTDILLGGNPEVLAAELLHKKGTNVLEATPEEYAAALAEAERICAEDKEKRAWPPAACTSSGPSATRRGASTTSSAAAPAARATRARRAST